MEDGSGFTQVSLWRMRFDFSMMGLSYVSSVNQVRIFLLQQSLLLRSAAVLLSLCILLCLRDQLRIIPTLAEFTAVWASSLRSGFMDPRLRQWLAHPTCSKQCMAMLFVPFCTLNIDSLTPFQCCSQVVSYFLAVKSLLDEDVANHMGDELRQFGQCIMARDHCGRVKVAALRVWCFACHGGHFALHAWVMEMIHPLVSFALLAPAAFVKYIHMGHVELPQGRLSMWWWLQASCMEPHSLFVFQYNSVFGLPLFQLSSGFGFTNFGNKMIWPMFWSQIFRIGCSIGLLLPWISSTAAEGFEGATDPLPTFHEATGQDIYHWFLVALAAFCVPLYTAGLIAMACVMKDWRSGEEDVERMLEMIEMSETFYICQE